MAHPHLTVLDPGQYRRTPWKNGGGVTVDIAGGYRPGAAPGDWSGMLWRFGCTRIERPGPFSELSGFDRLLAVIEGRGLILHPRGYAPLDVRQPFKPVRFAGEWPIESELSAGPVGVLNLLADRALYAIDLKFFAAGETAVCPAGHHIVLALEAAAIDIGDGAELTRGAAAAFDTAAIGDLRVLRGGVALASLSSKR